MIESKTLGAAAGTQYQGVNDKSESISLPSLSNGLIVGKFKRGRMDKAFTVNANNYRALLGHDPLNPSYLAVEDVFARGVSEVSIRRVGNSAGKSQPSEGSKTDFATLPINNSVTINNSDGGYNNQESYFSIEVNGVMYNADKSQDVLALDAPDLYTQVSIYRSSDGTINFFSVGSSQTDLEVRLSPSDTQKQYSTQYLEGIGAIEADGTFVFKLGAAT